MGYYTDFKLTIEKQEQKLTEHPVVQDIVRFMQRKGIEFDEHAAARMVTELSHHFQTLVFDEDRIIARLNEISGYSFDEDGSLAEAKWYDRDDHMRKLSAEFPNALFLLEGEGEEQGDVWKSTFKGGEKLKTQRAKMVFEEE